MFDLEKALTHPECKDLIQHLPIGIYQLDFKTLKLKEPNDVILEYTGYTKEEFENLTPMQLLSENSKKLFLERMEKLIKGENIPKFVEFEIITKMGKPIWVLLTTQWRFEDGNPTGAICIATNINQQKETECQLKKTMDRAQLYLDMASEIFVCLDQNANVTLINKAGCNMLRTEECLVIGKNWIELYIPENKKEEIKELFNGLINDKYRDHEIQYINPIQTTSNDTKIISWKNKVIRDHNRNVIGVFCSGIDITEKVKLENQLAEIWENGEKEIQKILKKPFKIFQPKIKRSSEYLDKALEIVINGSSSSRSRYQKRG